MSDLCHPIHGNAGNRLYLIFNDLTGMHFFPVKEGYNLKIHLRRSDRGQVGRIGEKGPGFPQGHGDFLNGFKTVYFRHKSIYKWEP
jgi:hypothetical protein